MKDEKSSDRTVVQGLSVAEAQKRALNKLHKLLGNDSNQCFILTVTVKDADGVLHSSNQAHGILFSGEKEFACQRMLKHVKELREQTAKDDAPCIEACERAEQGANVH